MEDWFTRVVAAAEQPAAKVRPMLPTPFEPALDERGQREGWGRQRRQAESVEALSLEVEEEVEVAREGGVLSEIRVGERHRVRTDTQRLRQPPLGERTEVPLAAPIVTRSEVPVVQRSQQPAEAPQKSAPTVPPPPVNVVLERRAEVPQHGDSGKDAAVRTTAPSTTEREPVPTVRAPQHSEEAGLLSHTEEAPERPREAPIVQSVRAALATRAQSAAEETERVRRGVTLEAPAAVRAGLEARAERERPEGEGAAPVVRIHIGRLEVRAVTKAPPSVPQRAPVAKEPPLSAYLAQRRSR